MEPSQNPTASRPESDAQYEARVRAEQEAELRDIYGAEWDQMTQAEKDASWNMAKHMLL